MLFCGDYTLSWTPYSTCYYYYAYCANRVAGARAARQHLVLNFLVRLYNQVLLPEDKKFTVAWLCTKSQH